MAGIKRSGPTVARKVHFPVHVAGELDLLLVDEVRKKPRYGALSQLMTKLAIEYLAKLKSLTPDDR